MALFGVVVRCFIACFLQPDCAHRLRLRLRSSWVPPPRAKLVPASRYHLTLRFLGPVPPADVDNVLAAVAALEAVPVTADVVGVGGFPGPELARVVFAELAPHRELQRWQAELAGLPGPDSPGRFVPHITLARSRQGVIVPKVQGLEGMTLELAAPALYESVPASRGVRYQQVRA